MKNARWSRLFVTSLLFMGALSVQPPAGAVHALIQNSSFCDGSGQGATGEGSLAQLGVHFDVFIPEYNAACPSGNGLVNFLGTGDEAAVRSLIDRTRPFAGSDLPLTAAEKQQIELDTAGLRGRRSAVLQFPLYIDGWAVAYNLPCGGGNIRFSSNVLTLIYSGVIKTWNHDLLLLDNPGNLSLRSCSQGIKLTRRSDVAGSTIIFKDYLSKRNPMWHFYKQPQNNRTWPTSAFACKGIGENGIAGCIASNPGAIGYVQTRIAIQNGLSLGAVENSAHDFVVPSPAACSTAGSAAVIPPGTPSIDVDNPLPYGFGPDSFNLAPVSPTAGDWSNVSITDGIAGYPVCALSYAFVLQSWVVGYASQVSAGVSRTTIDYLWVALSDSAQSKLSSSQLTRLPDNILQVSKGGLESVRYCGC